MPWLCATITASTTAELRRKRDEAVLRGADLVELRLDSVSDPDVAAALADRRSPLVLTCRPKWEGGQFGGSEVERRGLLRQALELGADYVDIEFRAGFDDLVGADSGKRIVLSAHEFDGVPRDFEERLRAMRATGAEVVKFAARAERLADCVRLLDASRREEPGRAVLIGLGPAGLPTRILASRLGARWTYAGDRVETGQLPLGRLLDEFEFRRITPATAVYGVVGSSAARSLSPAMHNAAFQSAKHDASYVPLCAESVDDFLTFARAFDVRGASVTIPFKVAMYERLAETGAETDPASRRVGAINTLILPDGAARDGGRWVGRNSDVAGFLAPLAARFDLAGSRAAVLGAGGAARAVAVGLAASGAAVRIYARDPERARGVAALVGGSAGPMPPPRGSWDLLVNATPVGAAPHEGATPFPDGAFDGRLVYDLVYDPLETRLLREAAAAGCDTIGGLEMLVAQAETQSEWWIGRRPPAELLRRAALRRFEQAVHERPEPERYENHVV